MVFIIVMVCNNRSKSLKQKQKARKKYYVIGENMQVTDDG